MKRHVFYEIDDFIPCSVFESLRSYGGRIFKLDEHLARFKESVKTIGLELSEGEVSSLKDNILAEYKKSCIKDAYIRFALSAPDKKINLIIKKAKLVPEIFYKKGVFLRTSVDKKNSANAFKYSIKSSNFMPGVFAKIESVGLFDALMLNDMGYVAESTISNIFMIKGKDVFTPPVSTGLLGGITRQVVFDLAQIIGIKINQVNITRHDLYNADECFLTSTNIKVLPVAKIDARVIGSGKPGVITKKLIREFDELIKGSPSRHS